MAPTAATPGIGSEPSGGAGRLDVLLPLAALAVLAARFDFLIDDAYIAFRYAARWAGGEGLSYNPGAAPPVEGYSDFLWVAALAALARVGVPLEVGARVLSYACAAGLVALLHRCLRTRLGCGRVPALLGTLLAALSPCVATWASGGLETSAFALLALGTWAAVVPRRDRMDAARWGLAGTLAVGLTLVRVEGFAWALVALGAGALVRRPSARELARGLLPPLLALVALTVFRRLHFEAWIANTAHAKSALGAATTARGLRHVASFLIQVGWPLPALVAGLALRGAGSRVARSAAVVGLAFLAYAVLVGGDWMPMFRFLAPAVPFLAVAATGALARLRPRTARGLAVVALLAGLAPAFGVSAAPRGLLDALDFRAFAAGPQSELERWRSTVANGAAFAQIGRALDQVAAPGDSITLGAIGAVGFHAPDVTVLDRNGLVDRAVARLPARDAPASAGHDKRVPRAFFLDRRPTWLEARLAVGPPDAVLAPTARHLAQQLLREGDAGALARSVAEAHALAPAPGLPSGATLVLLRRVDDGRAARAFWERLGVALP